MPAVAEKTMVITNGIWSILSDLARLIAIGYAAAMRRQTNALRIRGLGRQKGRVRETDLNREDRGAPKERKKKAERKKDEG